MANPQAITSMFGSRLSSAYNSLRGELGVPQTAVDTIDKLVEKIQTSAAVEDRRTAVLGLKGLSRDWREDVGVRAMPSLVAVLQHDAPFDTEIAKAALETLMQLCEVAEKPTKDDHGLKFTDLFLETPQPLHSLLNLLSTSPSFYPRFFALQYLAQLLTSRPAVSQSYIMSSPPPGVEAVLAVLDSRAPPPASNQPGGGPSMGGGASEMLRNEALLLLPAMLNGNADLQKIVAFSGAFEKLFDIINSEGGTDGGIVVQDAMTVVGCLLRFNVSNQNYFRELSLIPAIPSILGFPPQLPSDAPAPDDFALQFWPEQKVYNAGLVLGLIRMLIGGPGGGNQSAMVSGGVTRCLLELALSSNAPNGLKSQALNTLTPILLSSIPNQTLLSTLTLSPLVPVHADEEHPNGGFMRLTNRSAVLSLISSVVDGDMSSGGRGLRGRAAGVNMFEAYVSGNDESRNDILTSLTAPPSPAHEGAYAPEIPTAGSVILSGLLDLPSTPDAPFDPYRPLFSCLLLAHLVRNSEHAKKIARETLVSTDSGESAVDDDEKVGLVQLVVGNLMMAAREQTEAVNRAAKEGKLVGVTEEEDWTRVMVGYLVLLCTWLWDSPKTVKEFLSESANLQVLIQPITQATGIDPLVQGLSAFLLGVCYEFNRDPGEITRTTLHPILHSRIGPDQFVSRMARLREDPRFRAVQPDAFDNDTAPNGPHDPTHHLAQPEAEVDGEDGDEGLELWFDWAFVDFWKNHYYTIQRAIAVDPDAVRGSSGADDGESAAMIMSLRQKLKAQTDEVVQLQTKLSSLVNEHKQEKETLVSEVDSLSEQVATLSKSLQSESTSSTQRSAELEEARETHRGELEQLKLDLEKEREKIKQSEVEAQSLSEVREELGKAHKRIEELEADILSSRDDAKKSESSGEELKKRIETLEKELKEAKEDDGGAGGGGGGKKGKKGKANAGGGAQVETLEKRLKELESELKSEKEKKEEGEKEHEDLLVLLEELSTKRKRDKKKMKEQGLEVSEDEDEDDEDGEDAEE